MCKLKIFTFFILFVTLLFSTSCYARNPLKKITVDYNNEAQNLVLLDEENYIQQMEEIVLPFLDSCVESGFLITEDSNQLFYESFYLPENKATILILHGFTEFTKKFDELTYYFLTQGYNVVRYDQRGHGFSSRNLTNPKDNNLSKVHIEDFQTYVDDANLVYQQILLPISNEKPIFLFAHSMGGCVASLFIEENPNYFDGAILNAPMIGINLKGVPKWIISTVVKTAIGFNKGSSFAFDHGEFSPNKKIDKKNNPTKSVARYQYETSLRDNNPYYQSNGATFSWVQAALDGTENIFKQKMIKSVKNPIVIFQAGEDNLVSAKAQEKFARWTPNTKIIFFPQADHIIFNSKNELLDGYYYEIFNFLDENL